MLEQLAACFYDPLVFWGVPLVLALMGTGMRGARAWLHRRGR